MKFASFLASHASFMGRKDAVVCGTARLNFTELDRQTTRLAQALRDELNVQPGDRVALYLPNGVAFVRAFIAIIKAGGIAVPINLPLSVSEIAHILSDCDPKGVFIVEDTRAKFLQAAQGGVVPSIACDLDCDGDFRQEDLLDGRKQRALLDIPSYVDDCMVAYTSGTTGRAKGVILTQSNYMFVNGFLNGWHWRLTSNDRHLCTTPLAHRTGMARLMNMILHGSTLVVMARFDAPEAARLVRDERITVFGMVPTVGRMMLAEVEARPSDFATLRIALVTGEAFPLDVKRQFSDALPQVSFYSFYAMTEAGAITWLDSGEQFTHPASVGRAWPGVDVKLVGNDGLDVRAGEAGEIWVRSGQPGSFSTMREYFRRPEDTAKTIRDGWVATGDVGQFDADGYLYLMDRKKDMVLSGGYNIYSMEVELAIQSHPAVQEAAVIGVPDSLFGEAVAAYVVLEGGASLDASSLIEHCRERIASYKKPKYVFFVQALPRNSTGKVMKTLLRERYRADITTA